MGKIDWSTTEISGRLFYDMARNNDDKGWYCHWNNIQELMEKEGHNNALILVDQPTKASITLKNGKILGIWEH